MTRPWWHRLSTSTKARRRTPGTGPRRATRRPRVETLEDRVVPNAFADGGTDLALLRVASGSGAQKVFIDEYTTGGSLVQSVDMTSHFGQAGFQNTHQATLNGAADEGRLQRSPDRQQITYGGYDVAAGGSTAAAARVVAALRNGADATNNGIDTTTSFTNGFTPGAIQGAVTDGTNDWTAGTGTNNGLRFINPGGTTSAQVTPAGDTLAPKLFNYQLFAIANGTINSVGPFGIPPAFGSPPTSGATPLVPLPGVTGLSSPHDFVLMDRDPATPGLDTLYVADATGLKKFSYNAAQQTWVARGSTPDASGLFGITTQSLSLTTGAVDLFVIEGSNAGNQVLRYTDATAFNVNLPPTSVANFSPLNPAVFASNGTFRGIAFTPLTSGSGNFNSFPTATLGGSGGNFQISYTSSASAGFASIVSPTLANVNDSVTGNPNPPLSYVYVSIINPLAELNAGGGEFLGVNLAAAAMMPGGNGGILANYNQATHTLLLSGNATVQQYSNVLKTLSYQNASDNANFFRSRVIVVQANDGKDFSSPVFSVVQIAHNNVAPTVQVPSTTPTSPLTTNEINNNTNSPGTGLPFNTLGVNDVDNDPDGPGALFPAAVEQMTVSVDQGATLTLGSTAGVTIVSGANNSGSVTLQGTLTNLNNALAGLLVLPAPYFRSTLAVSTFITLTLSINDLGHTTGNSNSTLASPNAAPTVTLTPQLSASQQLLIRVLPVDAKPVETVPASPITTAQALPLTFTGANTVSVFDHDADPNPIQMTITATQGTITLNGFNGNGVPGLLFNQGSGGGDVSMTFQGTQEAINQALNGMQFTPLDPNYSGPASVRFFVNDLGNTGAFGPQLDDQTVQIIIQPVNQPPLIAVPGPQSTTPNAQLKFSASNANPIVVTDPDNPVNDVLVTLSVTAGTLKLGTTAGLTTVSGDGTSTITFTAPLNPTNLVDQALDGLTYTPPAAFTGNPPQTATLTVTVNDQQSGGGLLGGPQTASATVPILVGFPNQPPVITAPAGVSVRVGNGVFLAAANGTAVSVDDPDAGGAPIQVVLAVSAGTIQLTDTTNVFLVQNAPNRLSVTGTINDLNAAFASGIKYIAPTTPGVVTLTVTANDLGNSGSGGPQTATATVPITVNPPPPVFTPPTAAPDAYTTAKRVPLTVPGPGVLANDDPGVGPTALTAQLLTAPDPRAGTVALNPDGSFTYTPAANFVGTAVFTYQANNGAFLSAPTTVSIVVPKPPPQQEPVKTVFATGAGAGGGPAVNLYDATTGALLRTFFAYDPSFTGGVRVATGDVNGDGVPDIVTGAGPGGGPHVKVFDGKTGALIDSFFAYDASFTGGVFVAIGDVNGDGQPDIITGAGASGGPNVKAFDGATGALITSFFAYDPSFTGGVTVAAGDVNGDGTDDIVTGPSSFGGPNVKAFSGGSFATIASFFAYDPSFTGGVFVSAGDYAGLGRAQILTGPGVGGGPEVKAFDAMTGATVLDFSAFNPGDVATSLITSDSSFVFRAGTTVGTTSLNNDNRADIVVAPAGGLAGVVRVINSATLTSARDIVAYDPSFLGGVFVG
jgi:hypothetical protein